ncbi:MAG: glycosyltransferase, partial [archaeon]|nr:glycosyltransferase [archaeon]
MVRSLRSYEAVAGKDVINEIEAKAKKLSGKHVLCISSTCQGGGVAEILNSIVFLFNEAGICFGWRILHGTPDFFGITKKFHNGLQGEKINLSERKKKIYCDTNKMFSTYTHIRHDLVIVHDPQPLSLIDCYKKKQPWICRCHVDLSDPDLGVWNYLKKFLGKYDEIVVSNEKYINRDLTVPQTIIYPAIDPLSFKNKPLSKKTIDKFLGKYGIDTDRPVISQVSRFDKWKAPQDVVDIFELVREKVDCQLVLLGSLASDDPEGQKIFEKVGNKVKKSKYKKDIKLILVENNVLVNSLQRASSVIIQKSMREGFGLVISESLFKGTPVVAS